MKSLNQVAVIGCGYWGKNLIRNFSVLGALGAVCDDDDSVASAFSIEYRVPKLTFDEVLKSNVSSVVIAAPAELHFKLANKALNAGKNVYVEKPLALAVPEAEELCKIAERLGKILMVGHLLQYHPGFKKLKEMVLNGVLGKIQYIYSNRLSYGKLRNEEDVIWSFAPHDISMILSLVGKEPNLVKTESTNIVQADIADIATLHLEFPSGLNDMTVSRLRPKRLLNRPALAPSTSEVDSPDVDDVVVVVVVPVFAGVVAAGASLSSAAGAASCAAASAAFRASSRSASNDLANWRSTS